MEASDAFVEMHMKLSSLARFLAQEKLARGDGVHKVHGLCCNHVGIYIVSKKLLT